MSNKRKNKSFENSRSQQENQARKPQQEVPDYGSKSQNQQPSMEQKDCRG